MDSQSVEKIIETLAEYGVPLIKLYAIISVVGAVVFIIFFFAIFIMIVKYWIDMDKKWDWRK